MATQDHFKEHPSCWIKEGSGWVDRASCTSPVLSYPDRSSIMSKSTPKDTEVLLNILKVLRKVDTKLENQGKRLQSLENTSPSSTRSSTLNNDSPISRDNSTRSKGSKTFTTVSGVREPSNEYEQSLVKLNFDFEDTDENTNVISVVENDADDKDHKTNNDRTDDEGSEEPEPQLPLHWTDLFPDPVDEDLYSVSMYTGDILGTSVRSFRGSRMSLGKLSMHILNDEEVQVSVAPIELPPSPPLSTTSAEDHELAKQIRQALYQSDSETSSKADVEPEVHIVDKVQENHLEVRDDMSNIPGLRSIEPKQLRPRKGVSIYVDKTEANTSVLKVELDFHKVMGWKPFSFAQFGSKSKSVWQEQTKRVSVFCHAHAPKDRLQKMTAKARKGMNQPSNELDQMTAAMHGNNDGKKGVRLLGWRISITFQNVLHVSRENASVTAVA